MNRHVLIVEDDPDISLMMTVTLRLATNDVVTADSGEAALTTLSQRCPDVLVLDLGLPGIGGREVLRQVRADPQLRHLPVVVVSAHAGAPTIHELADLGCDRYLTKPFDPRELCRVVEELGSGTSVPL